MLALETGRDEDDEDGEDEDDVVTDAHATRWYDASTGEEMFVSGDGDDDDDASSAETEIRENGVAYGVDLARGHKTGFYVDQRDNRAFIRDIAAGKDLVMDVCCYTGGFALNAALGGARRVIGVDFIAAASDALDIARTSHGEARAERASPRRANSSARRRFGTSTRVWSAERLGRTTSSCSTRRNSRPTRRRCRARRPNTSA